MEKQITRRNLLEKVIVGGLIGGLGLAGLVGCKRDNERIVKKLGKFTLYVTEGRDPMYCGMPNKETFSLSAQTLWAVNYYYPREAKQINFFNDVYEVVSVDPEKITLRRIKK